MKTNLALLTGILVLLAGALRAINAADQGVSGDSATLQGTWTVRVGEKAGRKGTDADFKEFRLVFSGSKCLWKVGEKVTDLTFTVDTAKSPKQIDLNADGKSLAGIYQLDKDKLKLCLSTSGKRPSEFLSKEGEKTLLLQLEREGR